MVALHSTTTVIECSFINNSARSGGAIYVTHGTKLTVVRSTLFDNIVEYGGALSIEQSNATLEGCLFHNNTAQSNNGKGGAILILLMGKAQ